MLEGAGGSTEEEEDTLEDLNHGQCVSSIQREGGVRWSSSQDIY